MIKKRIIITGIAGYIGTELTKLYLSNSHTEIIGIDNRFIPERVAWMTSRGIKFVESDLFSIRNILSRADVVIHLAGITDVAYVATQANSEQDYLIRKIGIEGTNEIIKYTPNDCKIIFPSTHVIFEGLNTETLNINENFQPCPVLCYSRVKRQNELDLLQSGKKAIILRLASVYGYNENMRAKIVANFFAKLCSQEKPLTIFGDGRNYKPCVGVRDVARLMKFFEEGPYCLSDIFNIVNENVRVKDIALICKKCKPDTIIKETQDEIPNLGYTLSNKKLLDMGFLFSQSIEKEIYHMIELWSNKNDN